MLSSPTTSQQPSLVDKIVYLASLVTDQKKIDSMLDTLRVVTAHLKPGEPISPADEAALKVLYARLLTYLVKEDPVHTYTLEALEQRVGQRFDPDAPAQKRKNLRFMLLGVWVAAFAAYGISFGLAAGLPDALRPQLAAPVFMIVLHAGMAWFFLSSLKNFKKELKKAYLFITLAVINSGLAATQFPITSAFKLHDHPAFAYGGFMLPFAFSCLLIYLGLRIFAKQLDVRSVWLDWRLFVGVAVAAVALVVLLPHPSVVANESFYDLAAGAMAMAVAVSLANAVLSLQIVRRMTDLYRTAMRWFFALQIVVIVGSLNYCIFLLFSGELLGTEALFTILPFMFLELTWLQAGYTFKKASYN